MPCRCSPASSRPASETPEGANGAGEQGGMASVGQQPTDNNKQEVQAAAAPSSHASMGAAPHLVPLMQQLLHSLHGRVCELQRGFARPRRRCYSPCRLRQSRQAAVHHAARCRLSAGRCAHSASLLPRRVAEGRLWRLANPEGRCRHPTGFPLSVSSESHGSRIGSSVGEAAARGRRAQRTTTPVGPVDKREAAERDAEVWVNARRRGNSFWCC